MKGSDYEQFVFEKFKRLFADGDVVKNDHILGCLSGIVREIDVSIRINAALEQFLYIAQCKDWKTPADIKVLGEFSAVIQDVKASKGFLLCTSGFAKSNYKYASTLGIELITIEDIKSDKWKTDIQIPFIYIHKNSNYVIELEITANEAIREKNSEKELRIELTTKTMLTDNGGVTTICCQDYVIDSYQVIGKTLTIGEQRDIYRPNLHAMIADVWVPCSEFLFTLQSITKKYYLKYLKPDEYSHLRDHVNGTTLPLHVALNNVSITFDESFVELPDDKPPVFSGLFIQFEVLTDVEIAMSTNSSHRAD